MMEEPRKTSRASERFDDLRSTHRRIETASYRLSSWMKFRILIPVSGLNEPRTHADKIRPIEPFYAQAELREEQTGSMN